MKKQKGILGKLLVIPGVVLVTVGVFVFQGFSHADETTAPGGAGNVGVTIVSAAEEEENCVPVVCDAEDAECEPKECPEEDCEPVVCDEEDAECEPKECPEKCVPVVCDAEDAECEPKECPVTEPTDPTDPSDEPTNPSDDPTDPTDSTDPTNSDKPAESDKPKVLHIFTLRYNANGGTGAPGAQVCESYEESCGFVVADSVPAREGYEFRGWAKDGDANDIYQGRTTVTSITPDEPLTMYAVWAEIKTYTLMYDTTGGSNAPEVQACKSANGKCSFIISEVMPTKSGAQFLNWLRGDETYVGGTEIVVTETVTIMIANWNPVYNFTLNYVSEEGTENLPEAQKCETTMGNCTFIIATKEPTRTGYNFLGWFLEDKPDMRAKAGDELIVAIDGPLDVKIHAAWSKIYAVLNSGEVFGAGERVILRSSAATSEFSTLTIDSVEVPAEYYVVSEGETTSVVLSNAFSQSLSTGEHAFEIAWKDGKAGGVVSVSQNEDGSKRFVVVDANGNADSVNLMYRPKAGAVSKESTKAADDAATENNNTSSSAVGTIIMMSVGTFAVVYIIYRFYLKKKMNFIEEF